jgi:hypothetical protein
VLWYKGRIYLPNVKELKDKKLCEAHESTYPIHPGGIRCTMISRPLIGGMESRETLPSMLLIVTLASESRLNSNDLLDCYNHCKCLSGGGKKLSWILSWDCRDLSQDTIPFG